MPDPLRLLADQAFSRTAGAPLVGGNAVALLRDGRENYPAWLEAITSAERWIHFESYIIHHDRTGNLFAEALIERAKAGVTVRVLYDWLGAFGAARRRFWRTLAAAGVDVRAFNPPRIDSPFGWMARDHRKMLAIDGRVAFVTGLCVGDAWVDDPATGREAWRDTGVAVRGPAVADIDAAFADTWATAGAPLPAAERCAAAEIAPAGDVSLRVVASAPATAGVFRMDQLVAAVARETLWVTDAYFVGVSAYVRALVAAAADGVDVRLLVPGSGSDIAVVQRLTRSGYRALLEGGVRVFEWNGPMMHAKTAVADGRWARVGSTNLNVQSWLGNWELDVAIEDEAFGRAMQEMYEEDLARATEIVLDARKVRQTAPSPRKRPRHRQWRGRGGGPSRAAAGAMRISRTLGAAITSRREVGRAEASTLFWGSLLGLLFGAVSLVFPWVVAVPLGILALWLGAAGLARAWRLYREDAP